MAETKHFRGGAFTERAAVGADASSDGDFEYDHNGTDYSDSNWVNVNGVGVQAPQDGDTVVFGQFCGIVPADYSNALYPHVAGKHWCCCKTLNQADMDFADVYVTSLYTGDIYEYVADTLDAEDAINDGGNLKIKITGHTFAVGGFLTLGLTTNHNGEWRIITSITDYVTVDRKFVAETFAATATAVERTSLRCTTTGTIVVESNSRVYIECGDAGGGGDGDNIAALVFKSTSGILQISSDGVTGGGAEGNWDDILVIGAGTLKIMKNTFFTKMTIPGDSTNAIVIVEEGCEGPSSASSDLDVYAGAVTWDSKIGDVTLAGGTVTYCENVDLTTAVDIDKILAYGGTFDIKGGKGSLKDFTIYDGSINMISDGAWTVGSAAVSYSQYGGTFDLSQAGGIVSLYSNADIDRQGGELKLPLRVNASW